MASGLGWRDPQTLPLETANAGNGVAVPPDFSSHPLDFDVIGGTYHVCNPSRPYLPIFLQGCEIKSGSAPTSFGYAVTELYSNGKNEPSTGVSLRLPYVTGLP